MNRTAAWFLSAAMCGGVVGCSGGTAADDEATPEEVGQVSEALSICSETVPADRFIDGFPAYAQCPAAENSAIYSNNGIDTATSAMGPDWVRTQYSAGYQCTELAHRYWIFKWNVTWIPNGNAGFWCDTQPTAQSGVVQTSTPVHGDVMVLPPGSCGADGTTGHVAVVDSFDSGKAKVTVVQQNRASRGTYNLSCAKCFLHVTKNDGTPAPATGGAPGNGGATGSGGAGNGGAPGGGGRSSGGTPSGSGGFAPPASGGFPAGNGGYGAGTGGGGPSSGGTPATGGLPSSSNGGAGTIPPSSGGGTGATVATGGVPSGSGGASVTPQPSNDESDGSCSVVHPPNSAGTGAGLVWAVAGAALVLGRRGHRRRRGLGR